MEQDPLPKFVKLRQEYKWRCIILSLLYLHVPSITARALTCNKCLYMHLYIDTLTVYLIVVHNHPSLNAFQGPSLKCKVHRQVLPLGDRPGEETTQATEVAWDHLDMAFCVYTQSMF